MINIKKYIYTHMYIYIHIFIIHIIKHYSNKS